MLHQNSLERFYLGRRARRVWFLAAVTFVESKFCSDRHRKAKVSVVFLSMSCPIMGSVMMTASTVDLPPATPTSKSSRLTISKGNLTRD